MVEALVRAGLGRRGAQTSGHGRVAPHRHGDRAIIKHWQHGYGSFSEEDEHLVATALQSHGNNHNRIRLQLVHRVDGLDRRPGPGSQYSFRQAGRKSDWTLSPCSLYNVRRTVRASLAPRGSCDRKMTDLRGELRPTIPSIDPVRALSAILKFGKSRFGMESSRRAPSHGWTRIEMRQKPMGD